MVCVCVCFFCLLFVFWDFAMCFYFFFSSAVVSLCVAGVQPL